MGKAVKGYAGHVSEGSKIIHDGDKSHNGLIGLLGLSSEVHAAEETKGLADEDNPMEPVNKVHRYLKGFLSEHGGYSRDNLQDWLNLFCFIWNTPGDKSQKAQAFIELAAETRGRLRYREWKKRKNGG